jgi:hypothetical protein
MNSILAKWQKQRQKPQVLEISRLSLETATKLYFHEFHQSTHRWNKKTRQHTLSVKPTSEWVKSHTDVLLYNSSDVEE